VNVPTRQSVPTAQSLRSLQGVVPGVNSIAGAVGDALGTAAHGVGSFWHSMMHDPYLKYMPNQGTLKGVPQMSSWYDASAEGRLPLDQLDPVRAAILRGVLTGSGVDASHHAPLDPLLQMILLRGLNPQNARLG